MCWREGEGSEAKGGGVASGGNPQQLRAVFWGRRLPRASAGSAWPREGERLEMAGREQGRAHPDQREASALGTHAGFYLSLF